jgi:hypothetical protein
VREKGNRDTSWVQCDSTVSLVLAASYHHDHMIASRGSLGEKTWDATSKQVSGKRRRDASCSQFPIVASIQGHFTNISQVWREIGLSRRAMSLSVTALPLAWVLASPVRALAV